MRSSLETRCVLLTPQGSGAIAVVRVEGERADEIISKAFTPIGRGSSPGQTGRIRYGMLSRVEEVIDDVLVCRIAGQPRSAWEICSHGGVRVVQRVIEVLSALGARLDTPEGSRAEAGAMRTAIEQDAVAAMARVKTVVGLQFLAWQRAHLEDVLQGLAERWTADPDGVLVELRQMITRERQASLLLDGAEVAIIGPPNAGKSTLLNRLVGRTATLVSSTPGTTRDWVDIDVEVQGVPLRLIDTAGRHTAGASVEREAIRRGVAATGRVDLSLIVVDARCVPDQDAWAELCAHISPERSIVVQNKMDLMLEVTKPVGHEVVPLQQPPERPLRRRVLLPNALDDPNGKEALRPKANQDQGHAAAQSPALRDGSQPALRSWAQADGAVSVSISAKTGWGIPALENAMLGALGVDGSLVGVPAFFCDRQVAMAQRCVTGEASHSGDRADLIRRLIIGL